MSLEFRVFPNEAELAEAVAEAFVVLLGTLPLPRDEEPLHEVVLMGGRISRNIHRQVASRANRVHWGFVRFWWGDERYLPKGDPERNETQAHEDLLNTLLAIPAPLPSSLQDWLIFPVKASDETDDVDHAARWYSDLLRLGPDKAFTVTMLGLGPDGHIASLFPGAPTLSSADDWAVAVHHSPKPPPERVSLTYRALLRSERVWMVVSGEEKAEAVRRSLDDASSVRDWPARGVHGEVETIWWLDEAAASLLDPALLRR